jgi:hypothetical protein
MLANSVVVTVLLAATADTVPQPSRPAAPASSHLSNPLRSLPAASGQLVSVGPGRTPAPAAGTSPVVPTASSPTDQVIDVSVLAGHLTISPPSTSLTLRPRGHSATFVGDLPPVRVVDGRGSLAGWTATITVGVVGQGPAMPSGAEVCVEPFVPTVVAGRRGEVRKAPHSCGAPATPLDLFRAEPGGGGGAFDDSARVSVVWPEAPEPVQLTISCTFRVN